MKEIFSAFILLSSTAAFGDDATDWAIPDEKEDFHIFLLMGQSNMSGGAPTWEDIPHLLFIPQKEKEWAPVKNGKVRGYSLGVQFAKAYMKERPGITVGLIPVAKGGSSIDGLHKGSAIYTQAMEKAAMARERGVIKGVLWHQGESDTVFPHLAKAYEEKLESLVNDLRADLKNEKLPFVAGNLGEFYGTGEYHIKNLPSIKIVRKALRELPTKLPYTAFAESTGCEHRGDFVHFKPESYAKTLGPNYLLAFESAVVSENRKKNR